MISMHHKGAGAYSYQDSRLCSSAACSPLWWSEHEGCRCHTRWCSHAPQCPGSLAASSSPQYCWPGDGRAESWADLVRVILRRERRDIPVETSDIEQKAKTENFCLFTIQVTLKCLCCGPLSGRTCAVDRHRRHPEGVLRSTLQTWTEDFIYRYI